MKEEFKFSIEFSSEMDKDQIAALLPHFILVQENQSGAPRAKNSAEIELSAWQHTKLENGNKGVNGVWTKK